MTIYANRNPRDQEPDMKTLDAGLVFDRETIAAAIRAIPTTDPLLFDWGYECPRCGRKWIGRQGWRLCAARRHIAACVPLSPSDQEWVRLWNETQR